MPDPVQLCGSLEPEHPEFRDGFKCNQPLGHCRLNHGGQFWDHAARMNRWNDPDNPSIAHPAEQVCTAVDDRPGEAGKRRCQYAVGHPLVRRHPRPGYAWPLPKFSHGAPSYQLWWNSQPPQDDILPAEHRRRAALDRDYAVGRGVCAAESADYPNEFFCTFDFGHGPVTGGEPGDSDLYEHGAPSKGAWWSDGDQLVDAPSDALGQAAQLAQWWRDTAESEIDKTVAKAVEYGARDLVEIGRQLVESGVQLPPDLRLSIPGRDHDAYFAELGVYFYAVGKMARWTSAVAEGRYVSDDTLFDIGVYIRMAQRVRQTGQWP